MTTLLVSLLAAIVGWVVMNILWRPFERIKELRRRAHEDLLFFANIGAGSPDSDQEAARLALRKVGAALIAEAESAWLPMRILTRMWGWELLSAGWSIVALSNSIDVTDIKIKSLNAVFDALRLPRYANSLGIAARRPPTPAK